MGMFLFRHTFSGQWFDRSSPDFKLAFPRGERKTPPSTMEQNIAESHHLLHAWAWVEKNRKQVIIGVSAVAVVGLIIGYSSYARAAKEAAAGEALSQALFNGGAPNGEAPTGEAPSGEKPNGQTSDGNGSAPNGEAPNGQKPEKDMLDEMTLTLSGDTMTITVNDDTIITIDGEDATLDELQVGDTVSFFLDGEIVTSLSVGMPEPTQPMQAPEQN